MLGADAMHNSGLPHLAPTSSTWHSLVANTPLFILILDRDCRIRFVNHVDASEGPADVLGVPIYQFCPAEYHHSARQNIERVFATGQPRVYEAPIASIDGEERWYRVHLGPIFDGEQVAAVSLIAENTTEQIAALRRINEQLAQSEERYRTLLEACPDSVVMSALDGCVVFASRQTRQLLGLTDDDPLIGRSVLDYVVEADRPRLAANLADVIRSGERRNTAYRALRKDGEAVPVEASSAVIRGPDGQPQAAMAVIRDASEQQQSREALQRERRTLLHMLKASDRERQTIAYDIHDGLAQHLAAATMHFQTYEHLIDEYPTKAKAAYDAGVALVQRAHAEARRLISGVRPPALDEAGVAVAIEHLVHEQRQPDGPRIDYHYAVQFDRLPAILEETIYRVAGEALSNACTHGGSSRITMSLFSEGDNVHFDIQDWGVGFDPESIPDNRYGLEGMRQRVRLLGGELTIESTPGQGTRVHMTMPMVQ